jgi:hypothetical protein
MAGILEAFAEASRNQLREELQAFAETSLRHQLADLASLIHADVQNILQDKLHSSPVREDGENGKVHSSVVAETSPHYLTSVSKIHSPPVASSPAAHPMPIGANQDEEGTQEAHHGLAASLQRAVKKAQNANKLVKTAKMADPDYVDTLNELTKPPNAKRGNSMVSSVVPESEALAEENAVSGNVHKAQDAMLGQIRDDATDRTALHLTFEIDRNLSCLGSFVQSKHFENIIAVAITLNGIYMGVLANYLATSKEKSAGVAGHVCEAVFTIVFLIEILLKFAVHRFDLFRKLKRDGSVNLNRYWNLYDFVVVSWQTLMLILDFYGVQVVRISILRLFRLLRILYLVRAVHLLSFVTDLRAITYAISHSMSLLVWSAIAFTFLTYVSAVYFTDVVWNYTVNENPSYDLDNDPKNLEAFFGSIGRSMMSLIQAVTNGLDWGELASALEVLNPLVGLIPFLVFVTFTTLAMMNVVIGLFIDRAQTSPR